MNEWLLTHSTWLILTCKVDYLELSVLWYRGDNLPQHYGTWLSCTILYQCCQQQRNNNLMNCSHISMIILSKVTFLPIRKETSYYHGRELIRILRLENTIFFTLYLHIAVCLFSLISLYMGILWIKSSVFSSLFLYFFDKKCVINIFTLNDPSFPLFPKLDLGPTVKVQPLIICGNCD